jgi:hypothetical protein
MMENIKLPFSLIKFFQTTSLLNRGRYDYLRKCCTCHTRNDGSCTPDTILEVCLFLFIETEFSKNLARLAQSMRPVLTTIIMIMSIMALPKEQTYFLF